MASRSRSRGTGTSHSDDGNGATAEMTSYTLGGMEDEDGRISGPTMTTEFAYIASLAFLHLLNLILALVIIGTAMEFQEKYQKQTGEDQRSMYQKMTALWACGIFVALWSFFMLFYESLGYLSRKKAANYAVGKKRGSAMFKLEAFVGLVFTIVWLALALYVGQNGWRRKANAKQKNGTGRDEQFNIECNEKTNEFCEYVKPVGYSVIVSFFPMLFVTILALRLSQKVSKAREGDVEEDGEEADAYVGRRRPAPSPVRRPPPAHSRGRARTRSPAPRRDFRRSRSRTPRYEESDDESEDDEYDPYYEDPYHHAGRGRGPPPGRGRRRPPPRR